MELLIGIVIGVLVLLLLVVVHELGHAIVARRNGVGVKEFGVGFPPKAYAKKLPSSFLGKNVSYSVNWLPLGGFVRLQGEYDSSRGKGDYGAASYWVKTKILFAGVAVNWAVAALLLTILAVIGMPQIIPNQFAVSSDTQMQREGDVTIVKALPEYPAAKAGLKDGDALTQIANQNVESVEQFIALTHRYRGQTVSVAAERDGTTIERMVTLRSNDTGTVFGAGLGERQLVRSTWSAPIVGVGTTIQLTGVTLQGLGDMAVKFASGLGAKLSTDEAVRQSGSQKIDEVSQGVAGPVGILGVIFPEAGQAGPRTVLFLAAIISLSLAVMNALPIPALDGGRWAVMTLFRLLRKPLTREKEENIQATGMLVLLGLVVLIMFADIAKVAQ